MFGLGMQEIIVIALIILLLFGGKKIPELMKTKGRIGETNGRRNEGTHLLGPSGRIALIADTHGRGRDGARGGSILSERSAVQCGAGPTK